MFIRAYLRASTNEQDATRAMSALEQFTADHGKAIATTYTENASGAKADRPELLRLLKDARKGDVLLVDPESMLPTGQTKHFHHQWLDHATQRKNTDNFISGQTFFESAHLQKTSS